MIWLLGFVGEFVVGLFGELFLAILNALPGRRPRAPASLEDMQRRYSKSAVQPAVLSERWADTPELESVAFVVANRRGLSFRDVHGSEELLIAPALIAGLEVLDLSDHEGRQIAVRGHDGLSRVVFRSAPDPADVVADLTAALHA
jgi:hypothetical protein